MYTVLDANKFDLIWFDLTMLVWTETDLQQMVNLYQLAGKQNITDNEVLI